jgi:hypothetical protein
MNRRLRSWGARLALLTGLTASAGAAEAALLINEILAGPARDWNGSGDFSARDDEWVELENPGTAAVDLAGYLLTDGDRLPRYAPTGSLGPGERLVVYGSTAYEWERANGFPAFGLSLGNSGDTVMLWQVSGTDTTLIDAYAYRSHEAAADRSSGRMFGTGTWSLFDGLNPYTGTTPPAGTGCVPSPGIANECLPTPARETTWGRLKALYR